MKNNLNDLITETNYLPEDISKSERYYCWLNNLKEIPKCPICGKLRLFHKVNKGYFATCGDKSCKSALIAKANSESDKRDKDAIKVKLKDTWKKKRENNKETGKNKNNNIIQTGKKLNYIIKDLKYYLNEYTLNNISLRSFIGKVKSYDYISKELITLTSFLNEYNPDILERLYYLINDKHEIVKCQYCDNKAKWSGRINEGYKLTCCSKECESKRISEQRTGLTNISKNRDNKFIEWQNNLSDDIIINDEFIKDNIKYDKFINLLTNEKIISYLKNRYNDSDSLLESYQRILLNIEEKPKCSVCGKPVHWLGKKSKLYTKYCSDKCSGKSDETIKKKKQTQLKNWGTENCYDSEKYKQKIREQYGVDYVSQISNVIKKRKETLIKKYGTSNLYDIDFIIDKIKKTNNEKYGVDWIFQRKDIREKIYESYRFDGTSKQEDNVYKLLLELGYKVERQKIIPNTNWAIDFYLSDYDIYIEYQGSQFHYGRAFLNTDNDIKELEYLKEKDKNRRKITNERTQYAGIISTWTIRDVKKRLWMLENNYNFLELYDCLNINSLKQQLDLYINCLQDKTNNIKKQLYAHNPILRRKVIQNCCILLNKKESDLTSEDILNNFYYND